MRGWFGQVVLGILLTLLLAEGAMRVIAPPPRAQVIRPGARASLTVYVEDGVPLWYHERDAPRRNRACIEARPEAPRILALGDSIFAGVSVPPDRVWTRRLEAIWPEGPTPCILNLAEPGYSFHNELQVARREMPTLEPDLVILEFWPGSLWDYTLLSGTAYRFSGMFLDETGSPNPFLTPQPLHAWLFPRSRLYEFASMAIAIPLHAKANVVHTRAQAERYFDAFTELTEAHDAQLLFVSATPLDRPFDDLVATRTGNWSRDPSQAHAVFDAMAKDAGIPHVMLDERLAARGEDHLAIRLDPCCHFNDGGQQVLAEVLLDDVVAALRTEAP